MIMKFNCSSRQILNRKESYIMFDDASMKNKNKYVYAHIYIVFVYTSYINHINNITCFKILSP